MSTAQSTQNAVQETFAARDLRAAIPAGKGRISQVEYLERIRRGQRSGIQSLLKLINSEHSGDWRRPAVACVVGGGPSLVKEVGELRRLVKRGAKVIAVNKSHDWLLKRGIPCDYAVLLDPKDWVADYVDLKLAGAKATRRVCGRYWAAPKYLIASQCHERVIAKFVGRQDAYLWHAAAGLGESDILKKEFAGEMWASIAGASVVGLRAIGLAHGLGFRMMHLFGIDGSMKAPQGGEAPKLYAYDKPHVDPTWHPFEVKLKTGWSRVFLSNHHMARSVYEFEDAMREWDKQIRATKMEPFNILVHGDPEHAAISMVAAGMGIHANASENQKYGNRPAVCEKR